MEKDRYYGVIKYGSGEETNCQHDRHEYAEHNGGRTCIRCGQIETEISKFEAYDRQGIACSDF